jgi:HPt (histidine-containing phosphotransfer) domain-containing protein
MKDESVSTSQMSNPESKNLEANSEIPKSYDLTQVLKVSRDDMGFVRSVVRMFVVKTPIYVERIIKEFEAGNYHEMGEEAHQLKQSVYAMGINSLRTPIMAIILVGRNNKPDDDLRDHIENLKHHAELVVQQLKNDFNM